MCENISSDVTLDQRGCVHADASFHHDMVPECPWPSSRYSSSETDDGIAGLLYDCFLQLAVVS